VGVAMPNDQDNSPAIAFAVVGLYLFLIVVAACLYALLPPPRRKPASIALIVLGALMLATNSLFSWNNIKIDDWIMFTLLLGGFAVCMLGCLLHVRIKHAEKDRSET
jgi:uncharacterized membrane protein YfcA